MQDLAARMNAVCDAQPFDTSWYVKDLRGGGEADRAGHVPVPSASTRKTSIMMAALKAVHEGRLDLAEPVTFEERFRKDVASGTYRYMTAGCVLPLRDVIVNMMITSDNVCTQMVLERLTLEEMDGFCRSIGMTGTAHRHKIPPLGLPYDHPVEMVTSTTPADQGLLLDLVLKGTTDEAVAARLGCTTALCGFALDVLSWQLLKQLIPSLLPFGTKVAHKTGRGRRGRMDAGIVFRDSAPLYIITVYTDRVPDVMPDGMPGYAAAFSTAGRLSRLCWDALGG
ncbi:serine hydrolase [Muricoccus radiodurans]|uniref:serine hydrolase n=1 Tax=Muricoccus radiodurans TaxID=2231721 RepID=UPI003CF81166